MGRHGGRHRGLVKRKTQEQDESQDAAKRGVLMLPEAKENGNASPSPQIHQSTDPHGEDGQLHGEYTKTLHARQAQAPSPSPSVVYKTVVHVVHENGSTIGKFTVSTLPATVSNSELGVVTIPAETDSQIIVPSSTGTDSVSLTISTTVSASLSGSVSRGLSASVSETGLSFIETPTPSAPLASFSTDLEFETSLPVSQPPPASSEPQQSASVTSPPGIVLVPAITSPILAVSSSSSFPVSTLTHSSLPIASSSILELWSSTDFSSSSLNIPSTSLSTFFSSSLVSTSTTGTVTSSRTSSSTTSSTASSTSTTTSSEFIFGGGGGGAPTANGFPVSTFEAESGNSDTSGLSPPQIIGAVVGSVSGFVLVLLIVLFAIRARKRKPNQQTRALPESSNQPPMSPRTSVIAASLLAPARVFSRWKNSGQSIRSEEIAPAQRGFEKLGGRKLRPALQTGGDGYDDEFVVSEKVFESSSLAKEAGAGAGAGAGVGVATSSYTYGAEKETGGPSGGGFASSPPLGRPLSQESYGSEKVLVRPSPARAITTASSMSVSSVPASARTGMMLSPPPRPPRSSMARTFSSDGIGRSHASMDGSRTSRFTEGIN